jgi:hypothetical protein
MAVSWTDHVGTLRELLLYRVPLGHQSQELSAAAEEDNRGTDRPQMPAGRYRGMHQALACAWKAHHWLVHVT